jgi:hypothetical protein
LLVVEGSINVSRSRDIHTVNHRSPFLITVSRRGRDTHPNSYCIRRRSSSPYEEFIDSRDVVRMIVINALGITESSNKEVGKLLRLHAVMIFITNCAVGST